MFYGTKQIKEVQPNENLNIITFEDGTTDTLPIKANYLITEEPKDDTEIQTLIATNITKEFVEILCQHDIQLSDWNRISNAVQLTLSNLYNERTCKALGVNRSEIPETNVRKIRLSDLLKI